ncbi:MAG: glycoside hydrolase family 2 TIM barrel-domain containing protein [Candidatus Omnitrophota bacterium]
MKPAYFKLSAALIAMMLSGMACGQKQQSAPASAARPLVQQVQAKQEVPLQPVEGAFDEQAFVLQSVELKRQLDYGNLSSGHLTVKSWEALGKKDWEALWAYTQKCIELFEKAAKDQQATLSSFPSTEQMSAYGVLNDVGTCFFMRAEALMRQEKWTAARAAFQAVLDNFSYAQCWDPRGWFWKVALASQESIVKIDQILRGETVVKKEEEKPRPPASTLTLFDSGLEAIVDYAKYGTFENVGTKDYKYNITDQAGLVQACGEGVYPNTSAWRKNPAFLALKDSERLKGDHWAFIHTDDLQANFFKWNMAPEPPGVKQFYMALILEKAELWAQAVKAYYSIVVHFPTAIGWTYWRTPWYLGPVAVHKIEYITRTHPGLGIKLEAAKIITNNIYDNDVTNDEIITAPGKLVKCAPEELLPKKEDPAVYTVNKSIGGEHVRLVEYTNGHWQLFVDAKPFPLRSITYAATKIGQSPDEGTLGNWMEEDFNQNGKVDGPYDAWVDQNGNNTQDTNEPAVGDFQLLKEMGANCIRVYHSPTKINKALLAELYEKFGIMTIVGDFFGMYTIGSGAGWYEGTNYSNPEHQKNMLASVEQMVNEFKDEPWVLFWLLGNENNYGVACNAKAEPRPYYQFINEAAKLIKQLDPTRPVAICNGDVLYLDIFAAEAREVDIYGSNAYRGKEGFGNFWQDVQKESGKAAMITEYGCGAYYEGKSLEVADAAQAEYHRGSWEDIENNMAGQGVGNALGGIAFEYVDEWWKAYEPSLHDWKGQFHGPFPDGLMHEEWLGICGQGDGSHSPYLRNLRPAYYVYKELWNK